MQSYSGAIGRPIGTTKVLDRFFAYGFSGFLFAVVSEIKTIGRFNHTVNNMVHADKTLYIYGFYNTPTCSSCCSLHPCAL